MSMYRPMFWMLAALVCLGTSACKRGQPSAPSSSGRVPGQPATTEDKARSQVLARVGNAAITVGQLEDEINRQNPYIRMRYSSQEQKQKLLKELIRLEVLAQEARDRRMDQDPEVVRDVKRVMVNGLLVRLRDTLVKMEDITEADLKAHYTKNLALYQQQEMVRASQIVCETEAEAQKVLAKVREKAGDARHFAELVNLYSVDPATKVRRGDLDFFARDTTAVPSAVVEAVFNLPSLWQSTGPIKTDAGYVVLMKTGHRQAVNRPFEQEKEQIRNRLYNDRRIAAVEAFIESLQSKAKVEIDEARLAQVKPRMSPVAPPPHGHPH